MLVTSLISFLLDSMERSPMSFLPSFANLHSHVSRPSTAMGSTRQPGSEDPSRFRTRSMVFSDVPGVACMMFELARQV
jgi:hypothetical protein